MPQLKLLSTLVLPLLVLICIVDNCATAQNIPSLTRLLPRSIPDTTGYVLLEGLNFGTNISNINITFTSNNTSFNPCSSLVFAFPFAYLNCSLSIPNILGNETAYDVRVIVRQLSSKPLVFNTGVPNAAPQIADAEFILFSTTSILVHLQTWDFDTNSEPIIFFAITLPANGSITPATNSNNRSLTLTSRQIRYTARPYFFGRDYFQIKALDGFNAFSSTATIKISVPLIRDLHAEIVRPITFPLCSNNRPCTNDSQVIIRTLPRGGLKLLNGTDKYDIDSVPFSFPVDEAIKFEYIPPNELDYIKASMTYTLSTAEFDTTIMFYEGPLVSRDVRIRTNESTETLITLQCNFPLGNLLIYYWLLPTANSVKGNFLQFNSSLEFLNSQMRIRNGTRFRIRDDNGRMYFTADDNYSGIFEMQYFCTDGFGRISPPATLTVLVDPVIRCNSRTTIKNVITLSNRDIARDGISFRVLSTPEEGFLVRPETDSIPISAGDSINATTLKYITNITADSLLGGEFTYVAVNNQFNLISAPCTVRFVISCAPLYLNNFKPSTVDSCVECPFAAVCSFNGEFTPYASKGYWYNPDEQIYLACIPASACPGDINKICTDGYRGTRCGECGANYYKLNNQCIPCNSIDPGFITLVAACFVAGFYVLYLFWGLAGKAQGLGIINIACNFIQTTLILRNIDMNWPPEIQDILDYFSVFNFNLELSSPECLVQEYLNFSSKMKMTLSIPIVLLGFLVASMILQSKFVKRAIQTAKTKLFHGLKFSERLWIRDPQASSTMPRTEGKASSMEIVALFNSSLSLVYITVASYSLSLLDCTKERDGYFYLDADPSLRCYEEWWYEDLDYAVAAIALYVIGIPLYFAIILYFSSKVPFSGPFWIKFKRYCTLIFVTDSSYRENGKWFMLVQIFHKLMLVIVAMFFSRYISFQIVLTVLILMITLFMTLKYQPYTKATLNYLELYSLGSNIVILNLGLLFYNNQFSPTLKAIAIDVVLAIMASFILAVVFASAYEMKNQFRRLVAKQESSSNLRADRAAKHNNSTTQTANFDVKIRNFFGGFSGPGMRARYT